MMFKTMIVVKEDDQDGFSPMIEEENNPKEI